MGREKIVIIKVTKINLECIDYLRLILLFIIMTYSVALIAKNIEIYNRQ